MSGYDNERYDDERLKEKKKKINYALIFAGILAIVIITLLIWFVLFREKNTSLDSLNNTPSDSLNNTSSDSQKNIPSIQQYYDCTPTYFKDKYWAEKIWPNVGELDSSKIQKCDNMWWYDGIPTRLGAGNPDEPCPAHTVCSYAITQAYKDLFPKLHDYGPDRYVGKMGPASSQAGILEFIVNNSGINPWWS